MSILFVHELTGLLTLFNPSYKHLSTYIYIMINLPHKKPVFVFDSVWIDTQVPMSWYSLVAVPLTYADLSLLNTSFVFREFLSFAIH